MSTNSNCLFVQIKPDQWYYVLEDRSAPKNAWDWREYAEAYGPFPTEEGAHEHLHDNHANPGGAEIQPLPEGVLELNMDADKVLRDLIGEAPKNMRHLRY